MPKEPVDNWRPPSHHHQNEPRWEYSVRWGDLSTHDDDLWKLREYSFVQRWRYEVDKRRSRSRSRSRSSSRPKNKNKIRVIKCRMPLLIKGGGTLNFESSKGALVVPHYVGRKMTFYAIQENEMKASSFANTLVMISFSVASGLLTLGIGIRIEAQFQNTISPTGLVLDGFVAPGLWIASLIGYVVGGLALHYRSSIIRTIKRESVVTQSQGGLSV